MFEPVGGVVDALSSLLDALAGEDLHALSSPELLDRTREMIAARNKLDAELARTVRVAGNAQAFQADGMATPQAWLRGHCRLSSAAASQLVRNGRVLEQLPAVADAHAAGEVTADQLAVIGKITEPRYAALIAQQDGDLAGIGEVMAGFAVTHRHDELARLVHAFCDRLDADGSEPDPTPTRSCSLAIHPDGRVTGRFDLDPVGGEKVRAVIEAMVQANRPAGDERSQSRKQADALVQWADNTLATGQAPLLRTVKPHVAVKVGLDDLVDPSTGPGTAEMGFGAVISAARARWVACDADLTRIVLGPDGQPLDVGRTQRLVTPAIRKAVEHRDGHCVFAGCDAPIWWCEVHHLIAWMYGGQTSVANSGLLCERHHSQVHHGFRVQRDPAGRWHTYRPDGTEIHALRPPTPADDETLARAG
jgi:hypothetical protein